MNRWPGHDVSRRVRWAAILFALLCACASSSRGPSPAPRVAHAPNDINFDDFVLHEVDRRWARVSVDCAQAVVLEVPARGFRWGEAIWILAHGDHELVGQVQIDAGGPKATTSFNTKNDGKWSIDDVGDDAKCRDHVSGAAMPGAGGGGAPAPGGAAPGAPTEPPKGAVDIGFTFDASISADARPPKFFFRHEFDHRPWDDNESFDAPPLAAGTKIRIRFWGMRSIDWSGFVFSIGHYELKPKNEVAWRAKLDAERLRQRDMREKSAAASKEQAKKWSDHVADCSKRLKDPDCADVVAPSKPGTPEPTTGTGTPPPPPVAETPSPKPSDGATWVSGRWVWDGFKWAFWSKGFWRVPDSDRDGKHTPTAPSLPPPPKVEAKPPSPSSGAVWTPGYWHFHLSAWLWVDGAWRVPPTASAKWKPFEWRIDASGTIRLDPGGWF